MKLIVRKGYVLLIFVFSYFCDFNDVLFLLFLFFSQKRKKITETLKPDSNAIDTNKKIGYSPTDPSGEEKKKSQGKKRKCSGSKVAAKFDNEKKVNF